MNSKRGQQRSEHKMTITLPETDHQVKELNAERLLTALQNLPADCHALALGIVLKLAALLDAERKGLRPSNSDGLIEQETSARWDHKR